jgi:RNA polymerase sigma-70 factor (ECF subfamily)
MSSLDERAAVFTETRPLLFSIAYRMLGSVADAEDIVQDAYLRWQRTSDLEVREPRAYLTTVVTRLAINQLQSARAQRETYVGPWLPEPLVTEHVPDSSAAVELAESLSMAFLVMLERLSPIERAVLLLHDVFDFDHAEIARIIDKSEANCRQLLSRAKKHVVADEARFDADRELAARLAERFTDAARAGDLDAMLAVLAEDITLWADGGGKVPGAALQPIHGAGAVARFIIDRTERTASPGRATRAVQFNGQPGFVIYMSGRPLTALIFHVRDARIRTLYAVGNPDKLRNVAELREG